MMNRVFPLLILAATAVYAYPPTVEKAADPAEEAEILNNVRQLTFEGARSGEGYFSADGSKMIFQSEREEGNPFYQMYLLDLETGDTDRVSPGMGKTTCGWIHPSGKKVMYASTQAAADSLEKQKEEIEIRESGQARKYAWDYDAEFDLFEYDLDSETYTNLTNTEGYDAEGAYSPDGTKLVFASNRHAYSEPMSKEDADFFKLDKKFMMDLYISDADGSNVKRLTTSDGYDGGPFFSADGKKICWRRFDRKGLTAEIFTMNIDGTDEKQLTEIGAMSWAPFFHPSGEYLIFATNVHGFSNFELYLVDAAGEKEPVRVTYTDGFDGLPAFSPDGKTLSWTSKRGADKKSQIFLANWDHAAALAKLGVGEDEHPTSQTGTHTEISANRPDLSTTSPAITEEDIRQYLGYLASDELDGRLTGTAGEQEATAFVADAFEKMGLEPAGDDRTFFQPFEFTAGVAVGEDNALTVKLPEETIEAEVEKDWRPISFSRTGDIGDGGVVFAGYGMEIPKGDAGFGDEEYSSYFHLDVKGKWVMVLRYFPDDAEKEKREIFQRFSRLRHKATTARRKFAKGIIFVTGPESEVNDELVKMQFDASLADSGIPAISISTELATKMLATAGKDLSALQKELDQGQMVAGVTLKEVNVDAEVDIDQEKRTGRNVIARLSSGKEAPAVMVGAHIDHLGSEEGPGSLAKGDEKGEIHYGADDNASGVAGLLEIAQYLADQKAQGKLSKIQRDVEFAAWSGEELGLLGSNYFAAQAAKKLGSTDAGLGGEYAAYLNMDMIGRLDGKLLLQGTGSSDYWTSAIEQRNAPIGLPLTIQRDTYLPTDATTFYLRKVPILSAFTGAHSDYHTPRDTADKIDYPNTQKIAKLMGLITRGLALDEEAPKYVKVEPPKNQGARGFRVYLGTIPDYAQGEVKGVKLSGVAEKGPAAAAGVQGGDIIIGLAGKEILNIYDYTAALSEVKIGEETSIKVKRGEEEIDLKITPASRE